MALVAYGNSDSSDYEDDEPEDSVNTKPSVNTESQRDESELSPPSTSTSNTNKLFNILPNPSKGQIIEEDDEFLHKKETAPNIPRPKAKITVPSLSDFKDVENSGPSKPRIPSNSKSGLLSLLPQPKQFATTKSLIPHAVTNRIKQPEKKLPNKVNPIPKVDTKLPLDYSDDSDDDDNVQNDFFSFNKPVEELPIVEEPLVPIKPAVYSEGRSIDTEAVLPVIQDSYDNGESEVVNDYSAGYSNSGASEDIALDDEAIRQLCGSRGKRKRDEIQIVDVNQTEVLGDAKEWLLKGLMDDTSKRVSAKKIKDHGPTGQQKRKHQITYLAHQAKANEAELQNQWANNRVTKRKTQNKYGF